MDTLTHTVLGACIGELLAGKKLGKPAMLIGALAANLPDADVVSALWLSPDASLLAHRGFLHSFLFLLLASMLLAAFFRRRFRQRLGYRQWFLFFALQLLGHISLDACNAYGTGWWEPFSHTRVSFNVLFVADPLFTLWPLVAAVVLLAMRRVGQKRRLVAAMALLCSLFYLVQAVFCKAVVGRELRYNITAQGITARRYFTTPSPFNSWLWYTVVENESGYYTGYRSVFDRGDSIRFHFFPRNEGLLHGIRNQAELHHLLRFSKGYYTVQPQETYFVFNDLRFGQTAGWYHTDAPFSFHYYLQSPADNTLVVQRGRFQGWSLPVLRSLAHRIAGE